MGRQVFDKKQIKFLRDNAKGLLSNSFLELFNKEFNLNLNELQIINAKKRYGIKSGPTRNKGQFKKGRSASPKTQFKKGNIPCNHVPVGTETIYSDGYTKVKVEEPNRWQYKHLFLWEKYYGEVPEDKVVMFGDGDRTNFEIDNLILIARKHLVVLGMNNMIMKDADLTRTALNIVKLQEKIAEKVR